MAEEATGFMDQTLTPREMAYRSKQCTSKTVFRCLLDVVFIASVIAVSVCVELDLTPNHHVGFHCKDPTISYKRQRDTISNSLLTFGTLISPLPLLWIFEFCFPLEHHKTSKQRLRTALLRGLLHYRDYLVGAAMIFVMGEIMKAVFVEPRPHFMDSCRPEPGMNCTEGFITDYVCTNTHVREVTDSMRSFPSGHASITFYMASYFMWFIHTRVRGSISYLAVPWLYVLFATWCLVCTLSRITDRRHHWWDIVVGSLLGVGTAVFIIRYFIGDSNKKRGTNPEVEPVRLESVVYTNTHTNFT